MRFLLDRFPVTRTKLVKVSMHFNLCTSCVYTHNKNVTHRYRWGCGIVFYCGSGKKSESVSMWILHAGYSNTHTHTEAQRGKPLLDEFIQFSIHSLGLQQHVAERISFLLGEESWWLKSGFPPKTPKLLGKKSLYPLYPTTVRMVNHNFSTSGRDCLSIAWEPWSPKFVRKGYLWTGLLELSKVESNQM